MSSPESARYLGGEPTLGSRFLFEVDGVEIGLFAAVHGLQVTSQTENLTEGGLGIAIIRAIADEFALTRGPQGRGSRLRFAKLLTN